MVGLIFRLSLKRGAIWLIGRRFSKAPLFGGLGQRCPCKTVSLTVTPKPNPVGTWIWSPLMCSGL